MNKLALPVVALVAAFLCRPSSAATFTIANGDVTALAAAITAANVNSEDNIIELASGGTYTLTVVDNVDFQGESNGLPQIFTATGKTLTIRGNGATLQRGSGATVPAFRILFVGQSASVTITEVTISNGNAGAGGGIFNYLATLTVTNSTFTQNVAGFNGGGAIYNHGALPLPTASRSRSRSAAAAAVAPALATLHVSSSLFSFNSANNGGGAIFNNGGDGGGGSAELNAINSTFAQNQASSGNGGGGIYNSATTGAATANVTSCTFNLNSELETGDSIGNVANGGTATLNLRSSIFRNGSRFRANFFNNGTINSLGFNLSSESGFGALTAATDLTDTDPLLDPAGLKSNGGPTRTVALLPGSPAINRGDDGVLSAPLSLTGDQRGVARKVGASVDVGAFEFTAAPSDFDRNGTPDLVLFKPSTGQTAVESLRGNTFLRVDSGPGIPAGWKLEKVVDFNGDGKPDYLLSFPDGTLYVWLLNGTTLTRGMLLPYLPAGWQVAGVADLNADGRPDLLLLNPTTRSLAAWLLDGTRLASAVHITQAGLRKTLPPGWNIVSVKDMNGGGSPDLVLYHAATGKTVLWYLIGTGISGEAAAPTIPAGWVLNGAADFNADGKPDFLIANLATRRNGIWTLNGNALVNASYIVDGAGIPIAQPAEGWSLVAP